MFFHFGFLIFTNGVHIGLDRNGVAESRFGVIYLGRNGRFNDESRENKICHHEEDES